MSLFMPRIQSDYSADDMMEDFYINGIATVSRVAYKPYVYENVLYYRAYVRIAEWHDNESAYNFVNRLKNKTIETRFIYEGENWFVVRIDHKPWLTDLPACVVTNNYLLDDIDVNDHSGFFDLQPIDSDWDDIKSIVNDALDEFNDELYSDNLTEIDPDYISEYSDDEESLDYSTDEEKEEELRRADFEQCARDWYEDLMELKRTMPPLEFQIMEMKKLGKRTKEECQYENYLRTGNAIY